MDSKIALTLDMIRQIVYTLPERKGVKFDRNKGAAVISPDTDTIVTLDLNGINIQNNNVKVPIDGKRKMPWPIPDVHLAGNILITDISIQENNILFFNLSVDDIILRVILNFLRGSFPPQFVYLEDENYKVSLNDFIPEPYKVTVTELKLNGGIEVSFH